MSAIHSRNNRCIPSFVYSSFVLTFAQLHHKCTYVTSRKSITQDIILKYLFISDPHFRATIWDDHDRLLISSFQHVSLEASKDVAQDWSRGLLLAPENDEETGAEVINPNWAEIADYLDVKTINLSRKIASRDVIEAVIDAELHPLVFTVNDPLEARQFQSWGVDAMFSDEPDVIVENLLTVH